MNSLTISIHALLNKLLDTQTLLPLKELKNFTVTAVPDSKLYLSIYYLAKDQTFKNSY